MFDDEDDWWDRFKDINDLPHPLNMYMRVQRHLERILDKAPMVDGPGDGCPVWQAFVHIDRHHTVAVVVVDEAVAELKRKFRNERARERRRARRRS